MSLSALPTSLLCKIFGQLSIDDLATLACDPITSHTIQSCAIEVRTTNLNTLNASVTQVLSQLDQCFISAGNQRHVSATLCYCTSLRRLCITYPGEFHSLRHSNVVLPSVRHLKLCYEQCVSLAVVAQHCPQLTHLWAGHSNVVVEQVGSSGALQLQHLELFFCNVDGGSFEDLVRFLGGALVSFLNLCVHSACCWTWKLCSMFRWQGPPFEQQHTNFLNVRGCCSYHVHT